MRPRARIAATLAAVGVVLAGIGVVSVDSTDAQFTDAEYARATLQAVTIPAPVGSSCVLNPGVLGATPSIDMYWSEPTGLTPGSTYEYGYIENGILVVILTGPTTSGSPVAYRTSFPSGLLTGLLGGRYIATIRYRDPSGWVSPWLRATASMGALGSNPQCAISTDPAPQP